MIRRRFVRHVALGIGLAPSLGCLVDFSGYRAEEQASDMSGGDRGGGAAGDGAEGGSRGGADPSGGSSNGGSSTGGDSGKGGSSKGGSSTGGSSKGSSATGGDSATGGSSKGGSSTGGSSATGGAGANSGAGGTAGMPVGGMGGMSGSGMAGASGSGGSSGQPGCPATGRGPSMIEIPHPTGGTYCIDRSEVTNAMYAAFLDDAASVGNQGAACAWNTTFVPQTSASCDPLPYDPINRTNAPVACVDWCDAKAFCEWAGKRLCGDVDGGSLPLASFDDSDTSAWFHACSHGGDARLPYGDMYNGSYCAGLDYGVTRPVNVATLANCQGGYDGVWDMSGNVSEWEDACSAASGAGDNCAHRGGSWYDLKGGAPLYCNSSLPNDTTPMPEVLRRDARDIHVGFRCCANP